MTAPLKYLHLEGLVLMTPVCEYAHPGTGRRVTVVGLNHMGERAYFARVDELVAKREADGAVVYHEGAGDGPDDVPDDATDAERRAVAAIWAAVRRQDASGAAALGWVAQKDGLTLAPQHRRADLTQAEYVRMMGPDAVLAKFGDTSARAPLEGSARHQFRLLTVHGYFIAMRDQGKPRPHDDVELRAREAVALAAADALAEDVVFLWGGRHVPGFDAGLRKRGFELSSQQWLPVGRLPGPMRETAALIWLRLTGRGPRRTR